MPAWLVNIAASTWEAVFSAAPWITMGLLFSGLLYVYLPTNFVRRAMGGTSFGAVFRAALVGAPLPLCSCGVIPTALYLRKEGAGRGPVLSFLISTPETNIDSIAISYALMGPIMAVARPLAALITAITAGLGETLFGGPDPHAEKPGECGCKLCDAKASAPAGGRGGVFGAVKYGAIVLMRDLAPWLILGLVFAGIIGGLVPENFFRDNNLGAGIVPMLIMVALATPMYMCATASTPVAAALILKGVSPGAALVFLLVGPATNVATMTTVGRFLGKRSLLIYLVAMIGCSLLLGLGLDATVGARISAKVLEIGPHHGSSAWVQVLMWISVVVFLLLLANGVRLRLVPHWLAWRDKLGFRPQTAPAGAADPCCASEGEGGDEAKADDCPHCQPAPEPVPESVKEPVKDSCCAGHSTDVPHSEVDKTDTGGAPDQGAEGAEGQEGAEGDEGHCPHCKSD